jgi:hypothetical protein
MKIIFPANPTIEKDKAFLEYTQENPKITNTTNTTNIINTTRQLNYANNFTGDEININIWGLNIFVKRETNSGIPSELSVIVPRAEFRDKEIIISSLTIVIAPRHPPAEGS